MIIDLIVGLVAILSVVFVTEYYFWQRVRRKFRVELCPYCGKLVKRHEAGPEGECLECRENRRVSGG